MHSFPLSLFCVGTVGTVGTPHKQGLSALPLLFEQWEQWEQNSGQTAFFAHLRAKHSATSPTTRAPSVQISEGPDAPFGAFLDFSARRGFMPRPPRAAPLANAWRTYAMQRPMRAKARAHVCMHGPGQGVDALHVQGEQCGSNAVAVGHAQAGQTLLAVKGPASARQQSPMLQQNTGNGLVVKALAHLGPEHLGQ